MLSIRSNLLNFIDCPSVKKSTDLSDQPCVLTLGYIRKIKLNEDDVTTLKRDVTDNNQKHFF